jgi:hypothetical protein
VIEITFTLSEVEYIEAQKLYIQTTNPRLKWKLRVFGGIILISFLFVILTNLHQISTVFTEKLVIPVSVLVILAIAPWLQKRGFRKRYRIELPGITDVHLQIDEIGYHSKVAGQGQGEIPWSAFTSYGDTSNLFALFKGYSFYAIPKRALDDDQIREVEQLIKSHLPKLNRSLARAQGR